MRSTIARADRRALAYGLAASVALHAAAFALRFAKGCDVGQCQLPARLDLPYRLGLHLVPAAPEQGGEHARPEHAHREKDLVRVAQIIQEQAEQEWHDPASIRRQLEEAPEAYASGEMSDADLAKVEEQAVGRLVSPSAPAHRERS